MQNSKQLICVISDKDEKQRVQSIQQEWREVRSKFFSHAIRNTLKKAGASEKIKDLALQFFTEKEGHHKHQETNISLNKLGQLTKYKKEVKQLRNKLDSIQAEYLEKLKQCPPFLSIIKLRYSNLKVIRIIYPTGFSSESCSRSIFALELFKVIHENKLLVEVTIKGVNVERLLQFIEKLSKSKENKKKQEKEKIEDQKWIKNFFPSIFLKLSLNTQIVFDFYHIKKVNTLINSFIFFSGLFGQLSDFKVKIKEIQAIKTNECRSILEELLYWLRKIKNINIEIQGEESYFLPVLSIKFFRSLLLGGLMNFTDIAQLSLKNINFNTQVEINDLLAIEQIFGTLLEKNIIPNLNLSSCINLPIFPKITTLQSIYLNYISFRKQIDFMSNLVQSNPSLKFVKCSYFSQQWNIDERLFNQLETLIIDNCNGIGLININPSVPSNLKHISISDQSIGNIDCLSLMFPKLSQLFFLELSYINFGHQLLCTIPSPHLSDLHIKGNNQITDQGIQEIDQKWPYLRYIELWYCRNISENVLKICKFKGLMQLQVDGLVIKDLQTFKQIKRKGIRAYF